jgi:hypothetical protein
MASQFLATREGATRPERIAARGEWHHQRHPAAAAAQNACTAQAMKVSVMARLAVV